ncbi:hypothetical protein DH09_09030 [Bacillaceae bacterium JMAK1]|nr:hypothetical protein DH09_09030 [Bacillaceae bacterium JMAK1]
MSDYVCRSININNNLINGPGLAPHPSPVPPPQPGLCSKLYVGDVSNNSISVIDPSTGLVIDTIENLNDRPYQIYFNPYTNQIIASLSYTPGRELIFIDPQTDTVTNTIRFDNLDSVDGILYNPNTNLYYIASYYGNQVAIVDGTTFEEVAQIFVPAPYQLALDPATDLVYAPAAFSNYVSVISGTNEVDRIVVGEPEFGLYPAEIALNATTRRAYVSLREGNSIAVIDTATNTLVTTIPLAGRPRGIDVDPVTDKVYVALTLPLGQLIEIDGNTNTVTNTLEISDYTWDVVVDTLNNFAYVTDRQNFTVSTIDLSTFSVVQTTEIGGEPTTLAIYYYEC